MGLLSVGSAQEMTLGGREIGYVKYSRDAEEDAIVRHKLACAAIRQLPEEERAEALRKVFEMMGVPIE